MYANVVSVEQTIYYNYGLYQIIEELNTYTKDEISNQKIYDYPSLNGNIRSLAEMVKNYYLNEIVPILFKYEFLKWRELDKFVR